jgi:aminopeptidase N
MKWWDDLWLNESFAEFIAEYALEMINGDLLCPLQPSAMYFRDRKSWGYDEDERNSATHPIRGVVKDTDVAASIFDGITYAKGAAVLKQLMFLLGTAEFKKGIQSYMDRFKWSNATIMDLMEDLRPYFPVEIDDHEWTKTWLETASLNVIETVWDPSDLSAAATLKLKQTAFASEFSTLRYHKVQITFFDANAKVVQE